MKIYEHLEQGSQEWLDARLGLITASTIGQLVTPKTVKPANNDYSRGLVAALTAERITGKTEPFFANWHMRKGNFMEPHARALYAESRGVEVAEVGFITKEIEGVTIGYSPDGLVGNDGLIEVKSREQKKHLQTILSGEVPLENVAQIQAGLLVTGRAWCDYISWSAGMPLFVIRVYPDLDWHSALVKAALAAENHIRDGVKQYETATAGLPICPDIEFVEGAGEAAETIAALEKLIGENNE